MHQPEYRDPATGQFREPWTYLHAIKDYTDVVAHLEDRTEARACVNFSPVTLEQLATYAQETSGFVRDARTPLSDPLLAVLAGQLAPEGYGLRALAVACLRANEHRIIQRFPAFARLADRAREALAQAGDEALAQLGEPFFLDLVVWYHLAWLGESVRRGDPRVGELEGKDHGYDASDRGVLLGLITELLAGLIGRYRALAEAGRIELSISPLCHPIVPLLLDFASARESVPDATLPAAGSYPGGAERAQSQLAHAQRLHEAYFGHAATGCWPSEGAISDASLRLMDARGLRWCASGQSVLEHSLAHAHPASDQRHRPWRLTGTQTACFFRDVELSNLIGFTYKDWRAEDAVGDLLHRLDAIAGEEEATPGRVVAIIVDGENAWEYYPENGHDFLHRLYRDFGAHPQLRLTTFAECLASGEVPVRELPHVVAGSWVYGTLATWIGDEAKNRAWDLLCAAKRAFDAVDPALARRPDVLRQLAVCEGSDWFWWFGDYNPAQAVAEFDALFRAQLKALYGLLGQPAPAALDDVIGRGSGDPEAGGVMRGATAP